MRGWLTDNFQGVPRASTWFDQSLIWSSEAPPVTKVYKGVRTFAQVSTGVRTEAQMYKGVRPFFS